MLLENIYFLVQIIAGAAIVGSLIYVGVQLKQTVRESKLAAIQAVQASIGQLEETVYSDKDFSTILRKGMLGEGLSEIETLRLNVFYRRVLRVWQSVYYQFKSGTLDVAVWKPQARGFGAVLAHDRSARAYLEQERYMLDPEFVKFCEELMQQDFETDGYAPLAEPAT